MKLEKINRLKQIREQIEQLKDTIDKLETEEDKIEDSCDHKNDLGTSSIILAELTAKVKYDFCPYCFKTFKRDFE